MSGVIDEKLRIHLSGDWSMTGVTEQFPLLAGYFAEPAEAIALSSDQQSSREIDLTEVKALDACGCQLLVAFIHNLRRRGVAPLFLKLSDDCRSKIHTLGFDDELMAGDCV